MFTTKSNEKERFHVKCKLPHKPLQGGIPRLANTTIFTRLQNFISQEKIDGILVELQLEDKTRKCGVPTLLNYLVGAATFQWKSMRHAADVAPVQDLKFVGYSTLSKRLGELNYLIVQRIFDLIINRLNRSARGSFK